MDGAAKYWTESDMTKMQQILETLAAKKQRSALIESLGDTELDWMGYDHVNDIVEYVEWAIDNGKAGAWTTRFGDKTNLVEHINGFRTAL
jgi:hypothetical protein